MNTNPAFEDSGALGTEQNPNSGFTVVGHTGDGQVFVIQRLVGGHLRLDGSHDRQHPWFVVVGTVSCTENEGSANETTDSDLLTVTVFGLLLFYFLDCECASNRPSAGGKLLSGREGEGEVTSLKVRKYLQLLSVYSSS